jgi:hypothetical protein
VSLETASDITGHGANEEGGNAGDPRARDPRARPTMASPQGLLVGAVTKCSGMIGLGGAATNIGVQEGLDRYGAGMSDGWVIADMFWEVSGTGIVRERGGRLTLRWRRGNKDGAAGDSPQGPTIK